MKRVVSVSLGSSKRNKEHEVDLLGEHFSIKRIGTDGDKEKFAAMFRELDGKVDALGVGGADIYLVVGAKKYVIREIRKLTSGATTTPVVDGSGLKHTLERTTILRLQEDGLIDFKGKKVLLVSAVDRFGMAQALLRVGAKTTYGDAMFAIGMPLRVRSYGALKAIGAILLPFITRLPFQWIYPIGEKQEKRTPKFTKVFEEAEIIAGDWLYIKRYAPDRLDGKTIITNTLRKADIAWLSSTGAKLAITTTPMMGGETFATNVMEGVIVALLRKKVAELTEDDYLEALRKLGWKPNVIKLGGMAVVGVQDDAAKTLD